jgi:hypothetical protein
LPDTAALDLVAYAFVMPAKASALRQGKVAKLSFANDRPFLRRPVMTRSITSRGWRYQCQQEEIMKRFVMRPQPQVLVVLALVAAVFTQLPRAVAAGGDAVTIWNANAGEAATKACIAPLDDPFPRSRIYAMMHVAIHDELNAIDRRFRKCTFDRQAEPGASRMPQWRRRRTMSWSRSSSNSRVNSSRSRASIPA